MSKRLRAAIVGATGYGGAELVRLVLGHPHLELGPLVGHSKAGARVQDVLPSLTGLVDGVVESFDAASIAQRADLAFTGLPHSASAKVVDALRSAGLPVFDLSADFRLTSKSVYETWYGEHGAPDRFDESVYGLCELHREALRVADLVAVPGCYPTAALLALAPLVANDLISTEGLVVDAKSGVSGAGRSVSSATHLPESAEGVRAYKVGGTHRHTVEIEQELAALAKRAVTLTFTPHLVPMTRGILVTAYAMAKEGTDAAACRAAAIRLYEGSPSVAVLEDGRPPDTLWVRGSNRAHVSYAFDARTGRVVAMSAIDNLLKGTAGQAIQCVNLRFGFDEGAGIAQPGSWP